MMEDTDVQLQLKKRARRRLVGAVAFVSVVAIVLPMVMDHQPRQVVQDVEIRIPGQDEKPFAPKFAAHQAEHAADEAAAKQAAAAPEKPPVATTASQLPTEARAVVEPAAKPTARVIDVEREKAAAKPADKPAAKPEKPADKSKTEKTPDKPADKPAAKPDDAKRAAAILAGHGSDAPPAAKSGEYLVLIGAFANEANVKTLKSKLGEQGIKTISEALETPQGKKTRLRAGPFANREAAEKALEKMRKIGVSGVVAARQ